jgi:hypothetical protein
VRHAAAIAEVHRLLAQHGIQLTLLDIGASVSAYPPFREALSTGVLVEVDPDSRDFGKRPNTIRVDRAITDDDGADSLKLYLTKQPYCSSALKPDFKRIRNFPYDELFEVVGETEVPATSLNRLAAELQRPFDWIKLDTQGTEHRILQSMAPSLFARLICCDVEISYYAHYEKADTFPGLHNFLVANGFFISDTIAVQERVRLRRQDLQRLGKKGLTERFMKRCPTSPELRYIRAINHDEPIQDLDRFLRIWSIAYFTQNFPYCYFLAARLLESSDHHDLAGRLESLAVQALRRDRQRQMRARILSRLTRWWLGVY